jgi:hypothetical protein
MRGILIIVCLALAGCATPPRLPLPPEPVVVEGRDGVLPAARLYSEVMVRAFLQDEEGRQREVGNADCRLETRLYTASFRSPARVVVPFYGRTSPPLEVACRAGELSGAVSRSVTYRSADPYPWGYRWGHPWDPWYRDPFHRRGSGVWLGMDFGAPAWGRSVLYYPDIGVVMR